MHADVVVSSPMIALDVPWLSNTGSGRPCVLCELPDTGLEVRGVIRSVNLHVRYVRNMFSRGFLGLSVRRPVFAFEVSVTVPSAASECDLPHSSVESGMEKSAAGPVVAVIPRSSYR